jgi:hypothetical protein
VTAAQMVLRRKRSGRRRIIRDSDRTCIPAERLSD